MKLFISVFLVVSALASQSFAAERYSITKLSDGTVRIDHRTGAISYCREKEGNMICSLAAEERQAWISETENLSNRIDRLEQRITTLEATSNKSAQEQTNEKNPEERQELDKAMEFMEKAIRRFSEVFEDLKSDLNPN